MVHLNKARMDKGTSTKLQMRRIGPCPILAKYGQNAYKVELLEDLAIYPIFKVADLVRYKGPLIEVDQHVEEAQKDAQTTTLPPKPKLQAERILDFEIHTKTKHGTYKENLVKWHGKLDSEATWIPEN